MKIRPFQDGDTASVIELWERCGLTRPWNDPLKDIQRKLTCQPELFLVGDVEGRVVASAMAGYDGHRGSVYYLAVAPEHHGNGYGQQLMAHVEELLLERGCPKVSVLIRTSNETVAAFYRKVGYAADEVVSMGKRLIPDN